MRESLVLSIVLVSCALVAGFRLGEPPSVQAADGRVFELRTYTAVDGKLDALLARFRDHTLPIFEKHGITNIAYWVATDKPNTLIYVIAHESREAAKKSWAAFSEDPAWQKARAESEAAGRLMTGAESVFMTSADFSPMK